MGKTIFATILFLIFISSVSSSKPSTPYEFFFSYLISDDERVSDFISSDEQSFSERFDIHYDNKKIKLLIGYDIDKEIKDKILSGELKFSFKEEKLEDDFSKVVFFTEGLIYQKEFYFQSSKLISPAKYYTRSWKKLQGKYFNYLVNDEKLFNVYCIQRLDSYVDKIISKLKISETEKTQIENQKILYIFCKDAAEIKQITGYSSRGQFILNTDAIVTTYPCHFHEVSHFLINFKLKSLPLYTLPFLQEGFAVATGGRGGQSSDVLNDIGYYLVQNNIVDYKSLFKIENFKAEDASISYPIAGVFSKYLLSKNPDEYFSFYKKYSGNIEALRTIKSESIDAKFFEEFEQYLKNYKTNSSISFEKSDNTYEIITRKSFFLTPENPTQNYESIKFDELFKGRECKGEKYYFAIDTNEINIYNLYSNELIASFVNSFNRNTVKYFYNNEFTFYINKSLLDESLTDLKYSYINYEK